MLITAVMFALASSVTFLVLKERAAPQALSSPAKARPVSKGRMGNFSYMHDMEYPFVLTWM